MIALTDAFVKKEAPVNLHQRGLSNGYLVRLTTSSNEGLLVKALAIRLGHVLEVFLDLIVSPHSASPNASPEIGKVEANCAESAPFLHRGFLFVRCHSASPAAPSA